MKCKRRHGNLQNKNRNKDNDKIFNNKREKKHQIQPIKKQKSCTSGNENSTLTIPLDNLWWVEVSNHLDNKGYLNFILTCSTFYRICKNRTDWFKTKFCKRIETIYPSWVRESTSSNTEFIYYILPNGKFHGPFKSWFTNGNLRIETTYKDGKLNGLHRIFYYNGNIEKEIIYKDGKSNGIYRTWNEIGNLCIETISKDNELSETYRRFDEHGELLMETTYKWIL